MRRVERSLDESTKEGWLLPVYRRTVLFDAAASILRTSSRARRGLAGGLKRVAQEGHSSPRSEEGAAVRPGSRTSAPAALQHKTVSNAPT